MGSLPVELVGGLQQALGLTRAIETGTFEGDGTRELSRLFPQVVSIELSEVNHARAQRRLRSLSNVDLVLGDSAEALPLLLSPEVSTLYFLDGHWSEGPAGADSQCPIMQELAALRGGHPDDCIIIDDVQFFLAAPPPPYNPAQWPRLVEVLDAVRAIHPDHHVTIFGDQIIAVPASAASVVDAVSMRAARSRLGGLRRQLLGDRLGPLSPTRRALRSTRRVARDGARRWTARRSASV